MTTFYPQFGLRAEKGQHLKETSGSVTSDERANIFSVPAMSEAESSSQCSVSDTMPHSY